MSAPSGKFPTWRVLIILGVAIALVAALGTWWLLRPAPPIPPVVDLDGSDAEVVELVGSARRDVLAAQWSAPRWGHLGMVLRAHGFGSESASCFEQAEKLDPREPRWPYYRGLTLVLTDPEQGLACLRRAVARVKDRGVEPRFRLAEVLLEQGRLDEAEEHLTSLRRDAPGHARGRLLQARLALARQEPKKAIAALEGCWDVPYTRKQAHLLAAQAWQRQGETARGEELQATAARLPPDAPWPDPFVEEVEQLAVGVRARLGRAITLYQSNRLHDAIAQLEQTAEDHPRDVAVWVLLGQLCREGGEAAKAETALSRAVALDGDNVDGWFGLGTLRMERRPAAAAEAFGQVIRVKPDHTLAHFYLGTCLKRTGDREGARRALQAALRCQPDHAGARQVLGELEREATKGP